MNHADRAHHYGQPETIIGRTVHWRWFGYGVKDAPRFGRFYGFRDAGE